VSRIMWVCFGCKTESYGPDFQLFPPRWYGGSKNRENWTEYFSTVLTGNYRKCTTNCVGLFGLPNVVIRVQLSTLVAPVVPGPGKLVKIRPRHFFPLLIRNDKNCIPKSVGTFWALNRVIWAPFSNVPAPVVPRPEKSSKFDRNIIQPY